MMGNSYEWLGTVASGGIFENSKELSVSVETRNESSDSVGISPALYSGDPETVCNAFRGVSQSLQDSFR
jgi:hypothetical protein